MGPNPFDTEAPSTREVNLEIQLIAAGKIVESLESDKKSLTGVMVQKNAQVVRLEAEVVRLRMTRTDKELQTQVDGLRIEVGKKDRELVELKRAVATFQENEKITLRRATSAEQKIATMQETLTRMQRSRDAAHVEVEKHDRERLDAVGNMMSWADRAKKAEARIAELEGKGGKPGAGAPQAAKPIVVGTKKQ